MAKFQRRQFFVDPQVQGALVLRMLGYWGATIITVTAMVLCWRIMTRAGDQLSSGASEVWLHCAGALIASGLMLPLILWDAVRMSNRIAGPLYRLRRCMRDLASGMPVPPVRFREGDFWIDVAEEFNAVSAKLQRLEIELAEARGEEPFENCIYVPPEHSDEIIQLSGNREGANRSVYQAGRTGSLPMQ